MTPDNKGGSRTLYKRDFWKRDRWIKVGTVTGGHNDSIDEVPPPGVSGPLSKERPQSRGDVGNYNADKVAEALEKNEE
ncbi:MAG TPA: hypothetical protein VI795_03755 [Patescibacteria group bacterium]|nr:hypothetical protein [Patescibacteria group bacterium]